MLNDISLEVATIALTYIDAHNRDTWLRVGNTLKLSLVLVVLMCFDNRAKQPITMMQRP